MDLSTQYGFGNITSLGQGVSLLTMPAFSIASVAVILYFLFGIFKLISSGGDKNAVASARNMITHAIIGFLILMLVFLIIKFIPEAFGINLGIF
ncbi:hypothetical protein M1563_01080 [Patescibacteria group bacterium]|nr:hypothetical protein [Patescibacteria group bacterium]MCL5410180.1 hypothetical protein [Patescibacteria group bacterium]